jgi:linoleate 10R-lipoxygenase
LAVTTVLASPDLVEGISNYFYESTKKLVAANSFTLVGGKVGGIDIVRQVLRILPVYWAATDLVSSRTGEMMGSPT